MLRLLVKNIDICRISKALGKKRLKVSITKSEIIVDSSEITEDIADIIFENATVISAQNYYSEDSETSIDEETKSKQDDGSHTTIPIEEQATISESETKTQSNETIETLPSNDGKINNSNIAEDQKDDIDETVGKTKIEMHDDKSNNDETIDSEYYVKDSSYTFEDLNIETQIEKMPTKIPESEMVYRGEVYKWRIKDDGEGKIKECVIIIQNDYQNSASDDTIALFCTSHYEERAPIRFSFQLNKATMIDYSDERLKLFGNCTLFVGRIKGISRKNLGKYLGTMNTEFMNTLQPTIDFCLGLKRSRTVNWAQLQILSTVKMEELFRIAESKFSDKEKVERFLELFGFDMTCNGIEYVIEAILIARNLSDYRLEYLATIIAEKEKVEASEVLRLIVWRIKENFHFKKSPAISFIRLVERLLKKG